MVKPLENMFIKVVVQERMGRTDEADGAAWKQMSQLSLTEPVEFKFVRIETGDTPPGLISLVYSAKGTRR